MAVSIGVICTFLNAEDTLEATLESLRLQAAPGVSFFLVDDGSTDGGAAIARRFVERDPRFSLRANPFPGRVRALNLAVDALDTDYVAVLDADDLAHPAWLADAEAAVKAGPHYAVIGFERTFIRDLATPDWPANGSPVPVPRDVTRRLARGNAIGHSGAVIHRPSLLRAGRYDVRLRILEDYDLWIRLARAGHALAVSPLVRIAKRYHQGQKFSRRRGFASAAWKLQLTAIMAIDRDYRNFVRLGRRIAGDISRRPRRTLAAGMRRR